MLHVWIEFDERVRIEQCQDPLPRPSLAPLALFCVRSRVLFFNCAGEFPKSFVGREVVMGCHALDCPMLTKYPSQYRANFAQRGAVNQRALHDW
jgi:hypothetical protein